MTDILIEFLDEDPPRVLEEFRKALDHPVLAAEFSNDFLTTGRAQNQLITIGRMMQSRAIQSAAEQQALAKVSAHG